MQLASAVVVEDLRKDPGVAVEEVLVQHGVVVAQVLGQPTELLVGHGYGFVW